MEGVELKKIMVMGAGAVGGYFGGRLAQNSEREISLVARGLHLQAIRENGLFVESIDGDFIVNGSASDDPDKLPQPDLILFTVKSYDTDQAIRQITNLVDNGAMVLPIQNGIENFPKLEEAFGPEKILYGLCRLGARIVDPGVLFQTNHGHIIIGEKDGRITNRVQTIYDAFAEANVDCRISEHIQRDIWKKFSWNSIFNMLTALENRTIDYFYIDGKPVDRLWKLADEILMVARAEEVDLNKEDLAKIVCKTRDLGEFITSTLHDRRSGKQLEYDAFTGALLRLGTKHNIDLPEYRKLHDQLNEVNSGVLVNEN